MKRNSFFSKSKLPYLFVLSLFIASCTSYRNTARLTDISNSRVQTSKFVVDVETDFKRKVKGVSRSFRGLSSVHLARDNAYYNAIITNEVDVLVDPIYEISSTRFLLWTFTKAEVSGYAGTYKNIRTEVDEQVNQYNQKVEALKKLTAIEAIANEQRKTAVIVAGGGNNNAVPTTTEINTSPSFVSQFNSLYYNTTLDSSAGGGRKGYSSTDNEISKKEIEQNKRKETLKKVGKAYLGIALIGGLILLLAGG